MLVPNIGNHSLYWAGICKAKRIYSFEPLPGIYKMLEKNVQINHFEDIIIPYNIALGDTRTQGRIKEISEDNIGGTSIIESDMHGVIRIERLDDLQLELERLDFIKIDVEGFELKMLAGARHTLEKFHPPVFIEAFGEERASQVEVFFQDLGYNPGIACEGNNYLYTYPR